MFRIGRIFILTLLSQMQQWISVALDTGFHSCCGYDLLLLLLLVVTRMLLLLLAHSLQQGKDLVLCLSRLRL